MLRHIVLLVLLAVCLTGCGQTQAVREERAVNAILKLDGKVTRDETLPGRPVVLVDLCGTKITDAGLKDLKELKGLQTLFLCETKITDAGLKDLKELKELKGLRKLDLGGTKITNAGLKDLKQALPKTYICN